MRSLLILPADRPEALMAGLAARPAAIVLDLGDPSTGTKVRAAARRGAVDLLARAGDGSAGPERIVRIAPLSTDLIDADLDAVIGAAPDAVLLPRAVGARDVLHLGAKLAVREAECGLTAGAVGIVAVGTDTARGVMALGTITAALPRLRGLGFDGPALAADLAGDGGSDSAPWRAARGLLVLAATTARVPAIDLGLSSPDAFDRDCAAARRDGFTAKLARGPAEVAAIEAF